MKGVDKMLTSYQAPYGLTNPQKHRHTDSMTTTADAGGKKKCQKYYGKT